MSLSLSSDFHMWVEEGKVLQTQESKKKKKIWQQNSVISLESTIVQYLLILL